MTLRITRLRVEQLRRFRAPLELDGFDPGLNILAGPNEAGKSSLVRAIRAAFFERHKSSVVEDLRPWGEGSGAAPRVEIDFSWDGQPHRLVKSFLGRKRCTLTIGHRELDGVEAEDHLATLFGFSHASRGESRPEHWGIPGLLWVEQGGGQELELRHARDHLHDALQGQTDLAGPLASSGGDELLARLRADRDELLTSTGKPRAELAQALAAAETQRAALAALDGQIAHYRQQVDTLATLAQQQAEDERDRPWEAVEAALTSARQQHGELEARERRLAEDRQRLAELQRTRDLLVQDLTQLQRQDEEARQRAAALADAASRRRQADDTALHAQQQAAAAAERMQQAHAELARARQQADAEALRAQSLQAQAETERDRQSLARAQVAHDALAALRAQSAARPALGAERLQALRRLDRAFADASLQRETVATRLAYALPPGQDIRLHGVDGGHALHGQGELLLDAPAELQLAGGGQLRITPGGRDLASLAQEHGRARQRLRDALAALGVADLAEAEARHAADETLRAELALAEQKLAIVAPQGLDALHDALAQAEARRDNLLAACARLPAAEELPAQPLPQAEAALRAATDSVQTLRETLAETQRQQAAAQSRHELARQECRAAEAVRDDPARLQRRAQSQQQLLALDAEQQAVQARADAAQTELRTARPDIVAQDIARLARSAQQLRSAHQARHEQILVLQASLRQAGAQGLEEQQATLAAGLQRSARRADELQRRADALDLLCRKLQARREATLARLQQPLQRHLEHYLQLLLPGASVGMDEQLAPRELRRGPADSGAIAALSFGAREQIGVISRFAYADLLQQAGRPTLLILDDALVHSDSARLAQMKRVLFDASQRHQVLLFTCHPELWRDMGALPRQLP